MFVAALLLFPVGLAALVAFAMYANKPFREAHCIRASAAAVPESRHRPKLRQR